jgi:nicotinate-nucleotide pyrophosphorylase (carboxylating)
VIPGLLDLVERALDEDIGPGDLTTEGCVPEGLRARAVIKAKQELVVCGHGPAQLALERTAVRLGGDVRYDIIHADGAVVPSGTVIALVEGPMRVLLTGERAALNFLMKCSGIATETKRHVDAASGSTMKVVDTRKTTATLRNIEKYAVRVGGGHNHRHALYDGVLIKDNHISAVGSLTEAVRRCRAHAHHLVRIEVEIGNMIQLDEALATDAEVLLLDNMNDEVLKAAIVKARKTRPVVLEASGNMNPERIARIKGFGLDYVSAGGLIHQARWADLSMKFERSS